MTHLRPLLATIVVSLPFTTGLTLPVIIPLKIYEVVGTLGIITMVAGQRIDVGAHRRVVWLWLVFLVGTFISSMASLFLLGRLGTTALAWAVGRYDPLVAPIANLAYLAFVLVLMVMVLHAFNTRQFSAEAFIRYWLLGTVAAVVYAVLLNVVNAIGLPPAVIGYFGKIQTIDIGGLIIVRSGPFLEGNYFGLYLLISATLALSAVRRHPQDLWPRLVLASIIIGTAISAAPLALVGVGALVVLAASSGDYPRGFRLTALVFLLAMAVVGLTTEIVRIQIVEKMSLLWSGGIANHGNVSLVQRADESYKAWLMFLDHPWLGVGSGNYGYLAGQYPDLFEWLRMDSVNARRIPNNIYLEVLSEQGLVLALVFLGGHGYALAGLWRRHDRHVLAGFVAMMVYYLAFPSSTISFLWVWMAYVLHIGAGERPA